MMLQELLDLQFFRKIISHNTSYMSIEQKFRPKFFKKHTELYNNSQKHNFMQPAIASYKFKCIKNTNGCVLSL